MIRTFLLVFACSLHAYGQDTLATVFPKGNVRDTEVMFSGDSIFVRFIYQKAKKSSPESEAAWYNTTRKISDADVLALGSNNVVGIKKYRDSIYYYTLDRESNVQVFASAGFGKLLPVSTATLEGNIVKGLSLKENFLFFTWDQKSTSIRIYTFNGNQVGSPEVIKLWEGLKAIGDSDIVFIGSEDPARISAAAVVCKLFLYGDSFCAVFDSPSGSPGARDRTGVYKTQVFRKNLRTGEEDRDEFTTTQKLTFKSYVSGPNGNKLYRFASLQDGTELAVHDLDVNRMISRQPITFTSSDSAIIRRGATHHIEKTQMVSLSSRKVSRKWEIGLTVDEYKGEQIIAIGGVDVTVSEGGFPVVPASSLAGIPGANLISLATMITNMALMMKHDPYDITYLYLKGSSDTGFKTVPLNGTLKFSKTYVDYFDLRNMRDRALDYSAHFSSDKYWISLHSFIDSPRYFITKFNAPK